MRLTVVLSGVLILLSAGTGRADPVAFYKAVAESVRTAEGRVILYTEGGLWRTPIKVPGFADPVPIFIRTAERQRMIFDFSYKGGSVQEAVIQFRPSLPVSVGAPGSLVGVTIKKIEFDDTGFPTFTFEDPLQHPDRVLERGFTLDHRPSGALLAQPFPNAAMVSPCPADEAHCDETTKKPFINEVQLLPHVQSEPDIEVPALHITLQEGAQLPFDSNNLLKFSSATLVLESADYIVGDQSLEGIVSSLEGSLQEPSRIVTQGFDLNLKGSSSFKLQTVKFSRQPGAATIVDAEGGLISATIGNNSRLDLAAGTGFFLEDGTSVNLVNPSLLLLGDARPVVKIGANSTLNVSRPLTNVGPADSLGL